jgi:predicted nucleic acid-binding protein
MAGDAPTPQIHLDANAILRFLRFDIPAQANAVEARIIQARSGRMIIHVHPLVMSEVVFVLESYYAHPRQKIVSDLMIFLNTPGLHFFEETRLRDALLRYRDKNVSFVDAFLASLGAETSHPVFSFDRGLDKFKDVRRIER